MSSLSGFQAQVGPIPSDVLLWAQEGPDALLSDPLLGLNGSAYAALYASTSDVFDPLVPSGNQSLLRVAESASEALREGWLQRQLPLMHVVIADNDLLFIDVRATPAAINTSGITYPGPRSGEVHSEQSAVAL